MDESELVAWMKKVEQRLTRLEVQDDATPGAPDCPMPAQSQPPVPKYIPADYESNRSEGKLKWQQVSGAFCKRYEHTRSLAWHYGPHVQALEDITAWVNRQDGEPKKVASRLLDAFFADEYAKLRDYPPKLLASQCGRYYNPPAVALKNEPNDEAINAKRLAEHRQREQRELEQKYRQQEQEAEPPPPLSVLMNRIGRDIK